jgi:hypothetical protein
MLIMIKKNLTRARRTREIKAFFSVRTRGENMVGKSKDMSFPRGDPAINCSVMAVVGFPTHNCRDPSEH